MAHVRCLILSGCDSQALNDALEDVCTETQSAEVASNIQAAQDRSDVGDPSLYLRVGRFWTWIWPEGDFFRGIFAGRFTVDRISSSS